MGGHSVGEYIQAESARSKEMDSSTSNLRQAWPNKGQKRELRRWVWQGATNERPLSPHRPSKSTPAAEFGFGPLPDRTWVSAHGAVVDLLVGMPRACEALAAWVSANVASLERDRIVVDIEACRTLVGNVRSLVVGFRCRRQLLKRKAQCLDGSPPAWG